MLKKLKDLLSIKKKLVKDVKSIAPNFSGEPLPEINCGVSFYPFPLYSPDI